MKLPFQERKTSLRGILDLASGCYPAFLFGGSLGDYLPVFHFHDVSRGYIEPYFKYLAENRYVTVTSDELGKYVKDSVPVGGKSVVLCFDDAWLSMYDVVYPLLKQYGLTAITYVAPSLIEDSIVGTQFASWAQLKEMNESGLVDVQSHTWSHAMIYSDDAVCEWVTPDFNKVIMSRPVLDTGDVVKRINQEMLGCPIYNTRSRMSDAIRYIDDSEIRDKCISYVEASGGAEFFKDDSWRMHLAKIVKGAKGRFESEEERSAGIRRELARAQEVLQLKLGSKIHQICMPWGVGGSLAEKLAKEVGYESMVADELFGKRYARKGGNPYRIMRLKHQYIRCLPGKGRRTLFWT